MKFGRLAAAPLLLVLCLSHGCSDPPSPPAQAALTLKVDPAPGQTCTTTSPQLSFPTSSVASVIDELNCNLMSGCHPDDFLVVDRDKGAIITCSVAPNGDNFTVSLNISVDSSATGAPSVSFELSGSLSATGGQASISETNTISMGGGTQADCTVTIASPVGVIKRGSVWGSFDCPKFRDERNIGDTGCDMKGIFLFENCGG
jgi:hypothetical protein